MTRKRSDTVRILNKKMEDFLRKGVRDDSQDKADQSDAMNIAEGAVRAAESNVRTADETLIATKETCEEVKRSEGEGK